MRVKLSLPSFRLGNRCYNPVYWHLMHFNHLQTKSQNKKMQRIISNHAHLKRRLWFVASKVKSLDQNAAALSFYNTLGQYGFLCYHLATFFSQARPLFCVSVDQSSSELLSSGSDRSAIGNRKMAATPLSCVSCSPDTWRLENILTLPPLSLTLSTNRTYRLLVGTS